MRPGALLLALVAALPACRAGAPGPAALDTRNDACAFCRMAASDARFAAQLVAPAEEPRFFDDIGCLRSWLAQQSSLPGGAVAYVADHRTRAWVRADLAVYTKAEGVETPMSSHLIAHADAASRDADPDARRGTPLSAAGLFGPAGVPNGGR
jgi:copper chaperone NosL